MDYIHTPNPDPVLYDFVVLENSTINISPQGYDPDDDEIEYHYNLWKVDYDDLFQGHEADKVVQIFHPYYLYGNQWEHWISSAEC